VATDTLGPGDSKPLARQLTLFRAKLKAVALRMQRQSARMRAVLRNACQLGSWEACIELKSYRLLELHDIRHGGWAYWQH
jgi:hypothetical protein